MRVFFLSQDIHKLLVCFGKWDIFFSVIGHCIHKSLISLTTRGEEVIAPPLLWPVFHYKSYRIFFLAMVKVLKDSKMLCVISRFWIMALLLRLSSCFLTYPLTTNNKFTISFTGNICRFLFTVQKFPRPWSYSNDKGSVHEYVGWDHHGPQLSHHDRGSHKPPQWHRSSHS